MRQLSSRFRDFDDEQLVAVAGHFRRLVIANMPWAVVARHKSIQAEITAMVAHRPFVGRQSRSFEIPAESAGQRFDIDSIADSCRQSALPSAERNGLDIIRGPPACCITRCASGEVQSTCGHRHEFVRAVLARETVLRPALWTMRAGG